MFNSKQKQLFQLEKPPVTSVRSSFVEEGMKKSAETLSGNGALKYSTTGDPFVDQFGIIGSYKVPRAFSDIAADCELLWSTSRRYAILFIFYLRIITRTVSVGAEKTTVPQKGAGLKYESIMRLLWLYKKDTQVFKNNLAIFVAAGSWKDIFLMLQYDLMFHGWNEKILDWKFMGQFILSGLSDETQLNLIKKYLPQIKTNSKCKTLEAQADNIIAKWICSLLYGGKTEADSYKNYALYRKLKVSGTAHEWQQLISRGQHDLVDFDKVHGKALTLLVKSKYLANHGLIEKYQAWITAPETKEVKATGFVHEILELCTKHSSLVSMPVHEQVTLNKQFDTIVAKAGTSEQTNLIVVRDTSGSMGSLATGYNMSCFNIAKSLALYFSEFLKGKFANSWIEFNSTAKMHKWVGNSVTEKWFNDESRFVGSTNFQSVVELFAKIKQQGVEESEFPTGILCISDSEFNPVHLGQTNVEAAKTKLHKAGFSAQYIDNFVIVLWNLQSNAYGSSTGKKFETYGNAKNTFYFSGFDGSVISFLTSKIETPRELFEAAMNQELLNLIKI